MSTAFSSIKDDIYLDYYGCSAEVFPSYPDDMIQSRDYLSRYKDMFMLMKPNHVDEIVNSLRAHQDELKFMGEKDIKRIEEWRDLCIENPGYMVAYMNDY